MISIDPRSTTPIYRQVMDQVWRLVVTGQLAPGEQVESVASLAARTRVNPMTISKAYSALVDQGVLERRRGIGLFVQPLSRTEADTARRQILDDSLQETAALAVQLDVPATEAADRLRDHIARLTSPGDRHA